MSDKRISAALEDMKKSRGMLKNYLEGLEPDRWYWQPAEGINHVAWQVGHLAFAQHALCLKRVRGESPDDESFIPASFIDRYRRGSTPSDNPAENASVEEIMAVLDGVYDRTVSELSTFTDEQLDRPIDPPHPMFHTVLGGIEWAPQHEFIHVGQVILLRRLMGIEPSW